MALVKCTLWDTVIEEKGNTVLAVKCRHFNSEVENFNYKTEWVSGP